MTFQRQPSTRWHKEVPGARWFRADLHVHTIDDHPGGRAKVPAGLAGGSFADPVFLGKYARKFLQAAVAADVQVVALTPHAVKVGSGPETSAVWAIVECWNSASDDDGVPFRDKIYAVFPGFEPCFNVGSEGLHLLFLFDPEIGRERYLEAFTLAMGGKPPWTGNQLAMSSLHAHAAFDSIRELQGHGQGWDHIVLAPHVDSSKGLFKSQKGQVLQLFEHDGVAALEISDNKLPSEIIKEKGAWFEDGLHRYRHALYHASDAYKVSSTDDPKELELGHRITWLKLAQPRIEALRQAFLAADSRVAVAYERDAAGNLVERTDAPTPVPTGRPWLRRVGIEGGASFFGGTAGGQPRRVDIPFNPGLTCVIGASMTGKSTLLDGLRLHARADLPTDPALRSIVQKRGEGLLRGGPTLELETPGRTGAPPKERWPAVFYTQSELQSLMRADGATDIVRGLAGVRRAQIEALDSTIEQHDRELGQLARRIGGLLEDRDQAAQRKDEADEASRALRQFEDAGLKELRDASRLASLVTGASDKVEAAKAAAEEVRAHFDAATIATEVEAQLDALLVTLDPASSLALVQRAAADALAALEHAVDAWQLALSARKNFVDGVVVQRRADMERKLAEVGLSAEQLANLKTLTRKAELRDSYEQAAKGAADDLGQAVKSFADLVTERGVAVAQRRALYDAAIADVSKHFDGKIRIRRIDHALADGLGSFLQDFKQKGVTQWWNGLAVDARPSPEQLAAALEAGTVGDLGASATVSQRLAETIGESQRYALKALRSEDRYVFEQRLGTGEYRAAEDLSGGRRVSLLLTLLLDMEDSRPLVIDQPEDELDNRVLWATVLPALRRMKGRRQIILVTHNANIVVNGDADLVVQLEADADSGRVAVAGAIEDPAVRRAIVETVDGGQEAFELRKVKYGF